LAGAFAGAFFLAADLFGSAFLFANFLGAFRFFAGGLADDFTWLLFFDPVDFFLLFFLGAIREV
jgi:hypothetical protein